MLKHIDECVCNAPSSQKYVQMLTFTVILSSYDLLQPMCAFTSRDLSDGHVTSSFYSNILINTRAKSVMHNKSRGLLLFRRQQQWQRMTTLWCLEIEPHFKRRFILIKFCPLIANVQDDRSPELCSAGVLVFLWVHGTFVYKPWVDCNWALKSNNNRIYKVNFSTQA